MASGKEWMDDLKKMGYADLLKIKDALFALQEWPLLSREYGNSAGLWSVRAFVVDELNNRAAAGKFAYFCYRCGTGCKDYASYETHQEISHKPAVNGGRE